MQRITSILTGLALCLLATPFAGAGTVTYKSTHGEASGISEQRDSGEFIFTNAPASLRFSYTYDASIRGLTQGDTTTFQVDTLAMSVSVPGYFSGGVSPFSTLVPGTITWSGDTITFDATLLSFYGEPPSLTIDVAFSGSTLTPGVLPSSLSGLEGIEGGFTANAQPSIFYHGDGGFVGGEAVSAPEPSGVVLLAVGIGVVALTAARRRGRQGHTGEGTRSSQHARRLPRV